MTLEVGMAAATAARRAGVTVGRLRSFDEAGVVVPSARTGKGLPLYTPADVDLIRKARDLEVAVAVTPDELRRLLQVEALVKTERDKLLATDDLLEMRTVLAYLLSELND